MADVVQAAAITAVGAVLVAWVSRPARKTRRDAATAANQLTPNGGKSTHDLVKRTATAVFRIEDQLEELRDWQKEHEREHGRG